MVIRASASAEIRALVAALGGADDVHREAAIARLAVIGSRSVDRLIETYDTTADRAARVAILRTLEVIGDRRAVPVARKAIADGGDVGLAAAGALRALLASRHGATAAESLDILVAVALDTRKERRLRLAALEALQDMPDDVKMRVARAMEQTGDRTLDRVAKMADGDAARVEAIWTDAIDGRLPDDPASLRDTLATRGAAAPLNTLRKLVDAVREREARTAGAEREKWRGLRGSIHQALALRGSRVALYDLRESMEQAEGPLPVSFLAALHVLGDASCLDPIASAWKRAMAGDERWRHQLGAAFRAIAKRERITKRHAAAKRWPELWN
ncbi:MAG TPA: hypothetical protein VH740_02165 [Vicinamibacterales bacterium]|jgi:hypothetical protein